MIKQFLRLAARISMGCDFWFRMSEPQRCGRQAGEAPGLVKNWWKSPEGSAVGWHHSLPDPIATAWYHDRPGIATSLVSQSSWCPPALHQKADVHHGLPPGEESVPE